MVAINHVVAFNILIQDAAPSRASFGTIAVLAFHSISPERLVYDTTPDGRAAMVVDGFAVTSDPYRKNLAIGAQNPKVPRIKVYKRAAANVQAYTLTPTNTTLGRKYEFEVSGTPVSYTNGAAETATTISTAIRAQLAGAPNVTAGGTSTVLLSLTAPTGARIYLKNTPTYLTVKDTSPDAGIATALAAALLEDSDFYGVLIDSTSEPELIAAAAWCQSNGKIFHGHTLDSDVLGSGSTDVASDIQATLANYAKVWFGRDTPGQLAAAIMGRQFSRNPGSTTWENKRLNNITADPLTPTELANGEAKNCGFYVPFGLTTAATLNTASASGRFLDITRDSDWLSTNAAADVHAYLLNQEKVPFTQSGIDGVEGVLRQRFQLAEDAGVLDKGWEITLPTIDQIDPADKVLRQLVASNAFTGIFRGAIHGVDISGVLAI